MNPGGFDAEELDKIYNAIEQEEARKKDQEIPDLSVSEANGFSPEEITKFDIILMFKQVDRMLRRFYEPVDVDNIYSAMVRAQDKVRMPGINKYDNEELEKKHLHVCPICKTKTFHHILTGFRECAECGYRTFKVGGRKNRRTK